METKNNVYIFFKAAAVINSKLTYVARAVETSGRVDTQSVNTLIGIAVVNHVLAEVTIETDWTRAVKVVDQVVTGGATEAWITSAIVNVV